jgi:tRNA (mo5U34)-methyltransferase
MTKMSDDELLDLIRQHSKMETYYWNVDPYIRWKLSFLTSSIEGKTVLDIGCNEGLYSFVAEQRGAKRVVSVDSNPYWLNSFEEIKSRIGSSCQQQICDVTNVSRLRERYDIVLYWDVYYHLDNPLKSLREVNKVVGDYMLFCGYSLESKFCECQDKPVAYLFEPYEMSNTDPTNVWGATLPCIQKMLKMAGFVSLTVDQTPDINPNRAMIKASHRGMLLA